MSLKITPVFFKTEQEKVKGILNATADLIPDHAAPCICGNLGS
jgi:hypothetical protein